MTKAQKFSVLVTRPSPQGEILCALLQTQGFHPIFFPVIEINPLIDSAFQAALAQLDHYDWAIFISRSAVTTSAAALTKQWPQLPPQLKMAAIGAGTAQALQAAKLPVTIYPAEWSTEGLLALPEFQSLSGKKIALFRGKGGRELLALSLQARGAALTPFICYERLLPQLDLTPYRSLLKKEELDAIICTSLEGLSHLKQLSGEENLFLLQKIPLVLVSERIMIQAEEQGFKTCFLAKDPSHEGILQTLQRIREFR